MDLKKNATCCVEGMLFKLKLLYFICFAIVCIASIDRVAAPSFQDFNE